MIGWICIRLATGQGGESADQSGALAEFASAPAGSILLIVGGIAMIALAIVHLTDILFVSAARADGTDKVKEIVKNLGKAGVYGAPALTALTFGFGGSKDSGDDAQSATAAFMGNPFGRFLIIAVGLTIAGIGIYHIYSGATTAPGAIFTGTTTPTFPRADSPLPVWWCHDLVECVPAWRPWRPARGRSSRPAQP